MTVLDEAGSARTGELTLVEHLRELRNRLIKALLGVAVGAVGGFALYDVILELLRHPYCEVSTDCDFLVTDPVTGFSVRMRVASYAGLLLASPVVFWQLWRFIAPGLHAREKRFAVPFVVASVTLFVAGAALALWTFPNALRFLAEVGGDQLDARYDPQSYLRLVTLMMLGFGVGFEFPVLLVFLQLAGLVTHQRLASWRRGAIVVVFVAVAIVTPSGDPLTLLTLAVPMVALYEASMLVGRLIARARSRAAA